MCVKDAAGKQHNESVKGGTLLIIIAGGEIAGLYFPLKFPHVPRSAGAPTCAIISTGTVRLELQYHLLRPPCPNVPLPPPPSSFPILTNLGWQGDGYLNAKRCCNSTHRGGINDQGDPEMEGREGAKRGYQHEKEEDADVV